MDEIADIIIHCFILKSILVMSQRYVEAYLDDKKEISPLWAALENFKYNTN